MIGVTFWEWLVESRKAGSLCDEDLDRAIEDPSAAYDLFMECFKQDAYGTGLAAQPTLISFKDALEFRRLGKDDKRPA
jgi:hypothetical protein